MSRFMFLSLYYHFVTSITYFVFKCHSSGGHDLFTFCTFCGKLFFKAAHTIHVGVIGNDKRFASDLLLTYHTLETFVMPFFGFVFHFLHPGSKCIATSIASTCKLCVVTHGTKYKGIFRSKRLIH